MNVNWPVVLAVVAVLAVFWLAISVGCHLPPVVSRSGAPIVARGPGAPAAEAPAPVWREPDEQDLGWGPRPAVPVPDVGHRRPSVPPVHPYPGDTTDPKDPR